MLMTTVDKNPNYFTMAAGSLADRVFETILQAESENWVDQLIAGAHETNPTNEALSEFVASWQTARPVAHKQREADAAGIGRVSKQITADRGSVVVDGDVHGSIVLGNNNQLSGKGT